MSKWAKNKNGILIPNREAGFIQPGIGLMNKKQGGGGGGDPYWNNVVSLVSFNNTVVDPVGNVWTPNGIVYSSGTGIAGSTERSSGYVVCPYNAQLDCLNGDFTIEGFVNASAFTDWSHLDGSGNVSALLSKSDGISSTVYWAIGPVSTGALGVYVYNNGAKINIVSSGVVTQNTLLHWAVVRYSSSLLFAIDGIVENKGSLTTMILGASFSFCIGQYLNSATKCTGRFSQVRITSGVARYTANFTPPTAPFPNHS